MRLLQFAGCILVFGSSTMAFARSGLTYGDAQRMANTYPPGGNPNLWPSDPFITPQVDIRPFPTVDPQFPSYDQFLYCEDDWHTLAIAEFAHVFTPPSTCDEVCAEACFECLNARSYFHIIPFTSPKSASDWLQGLNADFVLDRAVLEITMSPVKAYDVGRGGGATWLTDGLVDGYGHEFGDYLLTNTPYGCGDVCPSEFSQKLYGVQFSFIIPPATAPGDPLAAGQHVFSASLGGYFLDSVTVTILPASAPACE